MGCGNREGSSGDVANGESIGGQDLENMTQCPFFEDVHGITSEELLWIAYSGNHIYHRSDVSVLGLGEDRESFESQDRYVHAHMLNVYSTFTRSKQTEQMFQLRFTTA